MERGVWLWDVETRRPGRFLRGPESAVESAIFDQAGLTVVGAARLGRLWSWEVDSGQGTPIGEAALDNGQVVLPGCRFVARRFSRSQLWHWNAASEAPPVPLDIDFDRIGPRRVLLSPDGEKLIKVSLWHEVEVVALGAPAADR